MSVYLKRIILLFFGVCLANGVLAQTPSGEEILHHVDQSMGYVNKSVKIMLKITYGDEVSDHYLVLFRNSEESIVAFVKPNRQEGDMVLRMGNKLWYKGKNSKSVIRITPLQRLTGKAAIIDIAQLFFTQDYEPMQVQEDSVGNQSCFVLDLQAKNHSVAYRKLKYYVDKKTYLPVKAEFYAISGKLLKIAYYQNFKKLLTGQKPTRIEMIDELKRDQLTVIEYLDMQYKEYPDKWFNKNYLKGMTINQFN